MNPSDSPPAKWVSLRDYRDTGYQPGRPLFVRLLWLVTSLVVFESGWFPVYSLKTWLLRCFGASVGRRLVIKPHVRIKYPWHLRFGDDCWIGEDAWIDNFAAVDLANDVCLSQGVYLCTGSHDYRSVTFDLIVRPIIIESETWIAAKAMIMPGVTVGRGAVVAGGSVVTRDVPPGVIVGGCPGRVLGPRCN